MLFISPVLEETHQWVMDELEAGRIPPEGSFARIVELDPDDILGLLGVGRARKYANDLESARKYFWRAIQAQPFAGIAYMEMAGTYSDDPESQLADGFLELAIRHLEGAMPPMAAEDMENLDLPEDEIESIRQMSGEEQQMLVADSIRERRDEEPEEVTRQLRELRLLQQMREIDLLDPAMVDQILAEGPALIPLLVGVLRGWARNMLDESEDGVLEDALALLGEMGSAAEIPQLLEFVSLDHDIARGTSGWALGRIMARHPAESLRQLESLATGLSAPERLAIAEHILRLPKLDPGGKLLEKLSENLKSMPEEDRSVLLPFLLSTMGVALGDEGVRLGRKVLTKQKNQISRPVWRECDELLSLLADNRRSPGPPPPTWTVYEICAGEVAWDEDEDDAEDDESPQLKPAPVIEMPGPVSDLSALRARVAAMLERLSPREMKDTLQEFCGGDLDDEISLIDWVVHDWVSPRTGRTMIQDLLADPSAGLSAREREALTAWSQSFVSLYEVQSVSTGVGIELKDLIFGQTDFVHDVSLSRQTVAWDIMFARVVPGERGTELTGATYTVHRHNLASMREWMDAGRRKTRLDWPQYLKRHWPRIRRQSLELAENWMDTLRIQNTAGDEMLFSKAIYALLDEAAVKRALSKVPEFQPEEDGFVWLDREKTVLANVRIQGGQLVLECNSRQRFERGNDLLRRAAGDWLTHERDEFTTQTELRRQAKAGAATPKPAPSGIPNEVRDALIGDYMKDHYRRWLDMDIPALDGKTPRQAAQTPQGRKQLRELIKGIENHEERNRKSGEPFYDVGEIYQALGLDRDG